MMYYNFNNFNNSIFFFSIYNNNFTLSEKKNLISWSEFKIKKYNKLKTVQKEELNQSKKYHLLKH